MGKEGAAACGGARSFAGRLALGTPVQLGCVLLCRRDRRHGKPGGLLHWGRRLEVERAVLRATPPVLAADGVGPPAQLGIVLLCRRDRRHGKPGGMLHLGRRHDRVAERAVSKGHPGRLESRPQARKAAPQNSLPTNRGLWQSRRGKPTTGTKLPVWHARLRAPRRGRHGKPGGLLHSRRAH